MLSRPPLGFISSRGMILLAIKQTITNETIDWSKTCKPFAFHLQLRFCPIMLYLEPAGAGGQSDTGS